MIVSHDILHSFPGQLEDEESDLYYNWHRYYDPKIGRYRQADPIGLAGLDYNLYRYVGSDPINYIDPWGLDWFRPNGHDYKAGRENTIVRPGANRLGGWIDDYVPAGHTFASLHDRFVEFATKAGLPDWAVNIPSMSTIYSYAVVKESLNSLLNNDITKFLSINTDYFEHGMVDDIPPDNTKYSESNK